MNNKKPEIADLVDSGMCWVSKHSKSPTKMDWVFCSADIDSKSNELQKA